MTYFVDKQKILLGNNKRKYPNETKIQPLIYIFTNQRGKSTCQTHLIKVNRHKRMCIVLQLIRRKKKRSKRKLFEVICFDCNLRQTNW